MVYKSTSIPIPRDLEGVYLKPLTGATTNAFPGTWNKAPWINPFFGVGCIANDDLFNPEIIGTDQVVNLALNTGIGSGSTFAAGE